MRFVFVFSYEELLLKVIINFQAQKII